MGLSEEPAEFLAECFWPGVGGADLIALDARAASAAEAQSRQDAPVRYLGSLLIVEDEVVLCRFEGAEVSVRRAAEQAGVPFERIVRADRTPHRQNPR